MSAAQPSAVSTKDTPRPPEDAVVTDENQTFEAGSGASAPAAAGEAGSNHEASAASDPQPDDKPKRDRGSERRIKKLTKRLSAAEERDRTQTARLMELERENAELREQQAASPEPTLDDFDDAKEYAEAYADWKAKTAAAKAPRERGTASSSAPPASEAASTASDDELREFHRRGSEKLGDEFLEAASDTRTVTPINQAMGDYILESEVGPELFVYLYHHPEEAREIYDRSAPAAVKRLDALAAKAKARQLLDDEGRTEATDEDDAGREVRRSTSAAMRGSRAPEPPNSGDDRGTTVVRKNPEDMSMDEYADYRRKHIARQ